jgi:enoyl-CoA hydratase/carnithine racemase
MSAITFTVDDRGVATVLVDHPPINLMTQEVFVELAKLTSRLATDVEVRVVILRSTNPEWFIAHFDVEAILGFPADAPPPGELPGFHRMCETLRTMPKPTIAVIEGRVGGGGNEIAMSCDMRFATRKAVFNQPEVALGIIPGGTGTVRLPRLVGRGRALEIILGCDDIDAATAEQWGMINRVLSATELDPFIDRLAGRIARFPRDAVAAAKASVVRADQELGDDLLAEATAFSSLLGNADSRDAMTAFLAHGGQTPEGERRLGDLAGEISG